MDIQRVSDLAVENTWDILEGLWDEKGVVECVGAQKILGSARSNHDAVAAFGGGDSAVARHNPNPGKSMLLKPDLQR